MELGQEHLMSTTETITAVTVAVDGQQAHLSQWDGQWKVELRGSEGDVYTLAADDLDTARFLARDFGAKLGQVEALRDRARQAGAEFTNEVWRYTTVRRQRLDDLAEQELRAAQEVGT
jgi:hypothetical protein